MGFSFDSQSHTVHEWKRVKRALLTYKSLREDLLVPGSLVVLDGPKWPKHLWDLKLGSTASAIWNVGTYSEYSAVLEEIGFSFGSQRTVHGWEKVKCAVLTNQSLHEDLLVPNDFAHLPKLSSAPRIGFIAPDTLNSHTKPLIPQVLSPVGTMVRKR